MPTIQLPDGTQRDFPAGTRPREVAESIGRRLAEAALAVVADGAIVELDRPLEDTGKPITLRVLT